MCAPPDINPGTTKEARHSKSSRAAAENSEEDAQSTIQIETTLKEEEVPLEKEEESFQWVDPLPGLVAIFSDFVGLSIIAPLLPEKVHSYGKSAQWVGYILSGQYTAVVFGSFLFGWLSDVAGGAVALSSCMLVDAALFAASGFAPTAESLLAMRLVVGLASPQGLAVAWIAAVSDEETLPTRMGLVAASIQVALMVGTALGGVLAWRAACLVAASPPLAALALVGLYVAVRRQRQETADARSGDDRAAVFRRDETDDDDDDDRVDAAKNKTDGFVEGKTTERLEVGRFNDDDDDDDAGKEPTTTTTRPSQAARTHREAVRSAAATRDFAAIAFSQFCTGVQMGVHFGLMTVALTEEFGLSRREFALALVPAACVQIANHLYLLPRLIRDGFADPFKTVLAIQATSALFFAGVVAAASLAPRSPWPFLLVQNVGFWCMSFNQGMANYTSARHAAFAAPDAKAALISLGRSTLNSGTAVGPTILIAVYRAADLRTAMACVAVLWAIAALLSRRASNGDPRRRPPSYYRRPSLGPGRPSLGPGRPSLGGRPAGGEMKARAPPPRPPPAPARDAAADDHRGDSC